MKSGSLIVKHHSPVKRHMTLLITVLLAIGGGWGLYFLGQQEAGFDQLQAAEAEKRLNETITNLEQERIALRDQIALLERSNQMDKQAYSEVGSNLKSLQDEILELREEVSFYRGIVAPNESSAGLRIEKLHVGNAGEERLFHYKLVVTQVLKNDRTVYGTADIRIEGLQDGLPKELPLNKVAVSGKTALALNFRYFQKFEGDILLPEGFTPRSIEVKVDPKRAKSIKSSFDWASLVGESEGVTSASATDEAS